MTAFPLGFAFGGFDVNLLRCFTKYGLGTGSGPQCPSPESRLPSALVRMPRGSRRSDASEVFPDGALCTHQTGHHLICLLGAGMFLGDASRPCGQTKCCPRRCRTRLGLEPVPRRLCTGGSCSFFRRDSQEPPLRTPIRVEPPCAMVFGSLMDTLGNLTLSV